MFFECYLKKFLKTMKKSHKTFEDALMDHTQDVQTPPYFMSSRKELRMI
jgi:hypothetical protein